MAADKNNSDYFSDEQEKALRLYLTSKGTAREAIFRESIYPALQNLVECIVRTYKLHINGEDDEETFADAMTFLMSKVNNFDPDKGTKAYSYFGTVCKRYVMTRRMQIDKNNKRYDKYDESESNDYGESAYTAIADDGNEYGVRKKKMTIIIDSLSKTICKMLSDDNSKLSENDKKVGRSLVKLFDEWDNLISGSESNKFKKSVVLYYLKESTMLSTVEVHKSLKVYKDLYSKLKENIL